MTRSAPELLPPHGIYPKETGAMDSKFLATYVSNATKNIQVNIMVEESLLIYVGLLRAFGYDWFHNESRPLLGYLDTSDQIWSKGKSQICKVFSLIFYINICHQNDVKTKVNRKDCCWKSVKNKTEYAYCRTRDINSFPCFLLHSEAQKRTLKDIFVSKPRSSIILANVTLVNCLWTHMMLIYHFSSVCVFFVLFLFLLSLPLFIF